MKKNLFTLIFLGVFIFANAQDSTHSSKQKIQFQSFEQVGLLAGESKSAYHVETVNGIRYKTFFSGIGVGIDNYMFRTIPLFLDVRKDILNKLNTPFVFVDAGSQFEWVEDGQKHIYYASDIKYKGKFYFNAGAGYKLSFTRKTAFTFGLAYALKGVDEVYTLYRYCDPMACPEQSPTPIKPDVNKYTLKRLALTAAITFW